MRKKGLCIVLAVCMMVFSLTACAGTSGESGGASVTLTFLNSKGEIQSALEDLAKLYREKTGVAIEIIACPAGGSPFEKISTMYNSGTPPTMAMLDTTDIVALYRERALDLSGERWVEDGGGQVYRIEGSVYSFPLGVEAKGLIYNKTIIETTLGRPFDPKEINTQDKLRSLFEELQQAGVPPMCLSKEDWSLGSHVIGYFYESQSQELNEITEFTNSLRRGEVDVAEDPRFNGLMDTFDILREYNISKDNPLAADYAVDPSYIADGEVAFWFNGNWAWPNIVDFIEGEQELGLMPMPISNDPEDFANQVLLGTGSKQVMIDKVKASEEEVQAAKDFLNWLVYDPDGQKGMAQDLNLVPAFSNIQLSPTDPLGQTIQAYVREGATVFGPIIPSDHWSIVGAYMQQYLAGRSDRVELANNIEKYWMSLE